MLETLDVYYQSLRLVSQGYFEALLAMKLKIKKQVHSKERKCTNFKEDISNLNFFMTIKLKDNLPS